MTLKQKPIRRISIVVLTLVVTSAYVGIAHAEFKTHEATATPPEKPVFVCPPCGCGSDAKTFDAPGECPDCGMGLVPKGPQQKPRFVALVVFSGVEILDLAGPAEVFAATQGSNGHEFQAFTVAADSEEVEANSSVMTIKPEYTIENCPKTDVVVIPGGNVDSMLRNEKMMAWIKQRAAESEIVMSVCNGAMVLAKAGLLEGLEATTHHGAIEHLRRIALGTRVVSGKRYVDSGKIITAAGVSAGIDAALHVVERFHGTEVADNTARYMEHDRRKEGKSAGSQSGR